ncbi:MAG: BamA/TamA family outer membrane protein [Pseudomonadota bacterium]
MPRPDPIISPFVNAGAGWKTLLAVAAVTAAPVIASAQSVELADRDWPPGLRGELERALDALEPAETTLGAGRLGQRAARLSETVLNANGYFSPTINVRTEPGPPPRPILTIDPGPLFTVDQLTIQYLDIAPDQASIEGVEAALTLLPAEPAVPARVIAQEGLIRDTLRRSGYPDADLANRETIGNREAGTVDVTYEVRSGPPVLLGDVSFATGGQVKSSYLDRFVTFPPGTPYSPDVLDQLKQRLSQDRLFQSVRVTLDESPARLAPSGAEVRDVAVTVTERPRNKVAAGVSFATNEGAGVTFEHERRNLSKRADQFTTQLALADLQRQLKVTWDRPHEFGFGRDLELSALASDDTTDAFDRRRVLASAVVEQTVSPALALTVGVNAEVLEETVIVDADTDEETTRNVQILGLLGGVRLDRADDALDPTSGWRANVALEPSVTQGDVSTQLLRLSGQVRAYQPLNADRRVVAALRLRAGSVIGGSFTDIPTDERFFGGGGGSVRGYEYQSIGPESASGQPLGGQSLLEASAELRWQFRDRLGMVAFLDAGNVTDQPGLSFDDVRFGAGIGLRYKTVAGPIRLDIGTPLDPRDGDDPVQIYVSVGQAF